MTRPLVSELLIEEPDFHEVIVAFVEKLPALIQELQAMHEQQDWNTMKDRIHDLKGLGGGYGYPQVSEVANTIESGLLGQQHDRIAELLGRIQLGLETQAN
ncbi:MAG: hypothetical protein AMJ68_11000 [Acidithiobacillales bacterium SG8_45]|nr:MAG: hypothetical protein AMJ68_11000 [Acidithiobacillales bacterium SG8_45]